MMNKNNDNPYMCKHEKKHNFFTLKRNFRVYFNPPNLNEKRKKVSFKLTCEM